MTKTFRDIVRWAIALVCIVPAHGQTDQHIVRLDMKDRSRHGPPETLPVYIEIATIQSDVEQGIMFTYTIENNGSQTMQILDPIEYLSVLLISTLKNGPGSLPGTKPDANECRLRAMNKQELKAYHEDKLTRRPFEVFEPEGVRRNRRLKTVSDIVPWVPDHKPIRLNPPLTFSEQFKIISAGKLTLEPGEYFQAVVQINRVVENYRAYNKSLQEPENVPAVVPHIISIPPGTYSLRVSSSIITNIKGIRWGTSSDRITIQLGEQNN